MSSCYHHECVILCIVSQLFLTTSEFITAAHKLHYKGRKTAHSLYLPFAMSAELPIILYHYPFSPYARRVAWYMQLRGIPYSQCMQPPIKPRPDIAALGIKYRRIPILSIGRDVYLDTRLIMQKLEKLYPDRPRLGSDGNAEHKAFERLLEIWAIDGGLFTAAMRLLPPDLPLLKDPKFQKDRADYTGQKMTRGEAAALRPEALNEIQNAMELLETTLLADGNDWILNTKKPSLADIETVWVFHWLAGLPGALPPNYEKQFPKVFAWIKRFRGAVSATKKTQGDPKTLSGEEAAKIIRQSSFNESEKAVEESEAVVQFHKLKSGQLVEVWPTDSGSSHKDVGKLVALSSKEVVIETKAGVHVHAPRHGFRVRAASQSAPNL
ncbi:hypothetical protein QBC46DRAFT_370266 [Diplogelasinospora grovesii]|uniref:GST N-terminal domain-containing protein n=1 Tax=Diplogelasinospora grovesii TaxID=303347 RepID=A0AAN6NHH0_9PEZI|nr:hypothetical protein QBC46DRAFT_370266 [Diplogelasinospora grovesii]